MGRVMLMMSVSIDGYFEGPDADLSWHRVDEELHLHFNELLAGMAAFLDGRVTYELMADYWPTADRDPSSSPAEAAFARIWRDMPKIVYSTTLTSAEWNTAVVPAVVPDEVRALKAGATGDLALGGAELATTFLRHDLIDVIRLYVQPVVLGRGRRLFPGPADPVDLRLIETRTFHNGVVLLHYERDR